MSASSAARGAGRRENALLELARIPVVRRMWAAITFSSFGDWLGLLANTALAEQLTSGSSLLTQGAAFSGVILIRLSPDLLFGPVAAALADKFDRRTLVIVGDLAAGLLYATIALAHNLVWLYVAQFLIEAVGLFTQPAKQVIQTTIVPRRLLATANQVSLSSVYGTVPIAAGVFALLSAIDRLVEGNGSADVAIVIALLINTVSFVVSSTTVLVSRQMIQVAPADRERGKSVFTLLREGVGFVRGQRKILALYVGIIGAFAAGGLTVGVARPWVETLDAGTAGFSIMFGTVFTGLAMGMLLGPRMLPGYTRSRVFALAIASAGVALLVMSLLSDFVLAVLFASLVGLFAGMAWIIGYTMIGHEVEDRLRGRVFAFVLSSVRLILLLTIAVGPLLAGVLGDHSIAIGDGSRLRFSGPGLTLLIGGVLALAVGGYALRRATPSRTTVRSLARRRLLRSGARRTGERGGLLIAVDALDEHSTASCATAICTRLRGHGLEVVQVGPPAVTQPGTDVVPETAALSTAAARAQQVSTVIRPALERGAVVVCERFVLTSKAVFGGGRGADVDQVGAAERWATGGLRTDLTLVLPDDGADVGPDVGPDFDAQAAAAVLLDALEADRDNHLLIEPDAGLDELDARLERLLRLRHGALSPAEIDDAAGVPAAGIGGVEIADELPTDRGNDPGSESAGDAVAR